MAVPLGPTALDENGQPSSGKTFGTSYNPNQPQPHAFRFYCFNSPFLNYLHTIFDNGAGRKKISSAVVDQSKVYPLKRYVGVFPEARKLVHKFFHERVQGEDDDLPIDKKSSAALWAIMAAQQDMKSDSDESKVVFTDSYYTRHYLGKWNNICQLLPSSCFCSVRKYTDSHW